MSSGLRKGFTSYGDPGFSLFLRKAFIKAKGFSDDALDRPIIGVTDTYSDFNPCHGNVPQLIEAVKRGVMLAGGLPMEFPTISIHESFSPPTSMYLRNLMSIDTEEMVRAQPMDAVVVIGGCDKTLPAQVMGAVSADKPAIVVPTGPMVVGHHKGEVLGACTDCRRLWAQHRAGKMDEAEIEVVSGRLAPSVGTCMVMGTASTMACVIEALGFSLPYAAAVPAVHAERVRIAEASGKQAVAMAKAGSPRPRELFTERSLAQRADRAAGDRRLDQRHRASRRDGGARRHHARSRCVRCAVEAGAGADRPEAVGRSLHGALPSRRRRAAADAGAVRHSRSRCADASPARLRDHVKLAEQVPGQTVIRSRANPINPQGAMCVLRGNLAPRGAVIKQSAATPKLMTHEGRAVVFELGRGHDGADGRSEPRRRPPTTCWCCAMPGRRARRACRRPATCRSRRSSRSRA